MSTAAPTVGLLDRRQRARLPAVGRGGSSADWALVASICSGEGRCRPAAPTSCPSILSTVESPEVVSKLCAAPSRVTQADSPSGGELHQLGAEAEHTRSQ